MLIRDSLWLYGFAFVIYILFHLSRTPKKLDIERDTRETALLSYISSRDQTIKERDEEIRISKEKPKRTAAEQHAHDAVERALKVVGKKGITALRLLRTHGTITFNFNASSVPLSA